MPNLQIAVGDNYIPDLQKRMAKHGITAAELAREMGKSEQELSRWFNSAKRFGKQWTPKMDNIRKIEMAIVNIRRREGRAAKHRVSQRA